MRIKIKNKEFIVTDMIVIDHKRDSHMKYNVFDEKYNHVTSIDAEDEIEFMKLFNSYLVKNNYFENEMV